MSSSSNAAPEFFTVFLPEFCSHYLKIRSSFKGHVEREATGEAIIERYATNQKWKVDFVKEDGEFLFKKGWKEFVTDNGLTVGEFMVFSYLGNSRFTVDIFGTNGLERFNPAKQASTLGDEIDENDSDKDDFEDEDYEDVAGTTRELNQMTILNNNKRRRPYKLNRSSKAISEANKLMLELKNPCFMVYMTKSYVSRATIHLPRAFMSRYFGEKIPDQVQLVTSGKTWKVKVSKYHSRTSNAIYNKLGKGFEGFLGKNEVQERDVCVFEAVDLPSATFKVSILRAL